LGLDDDDDYVTDRERAALVIELVEAGHGHQILLSSNAVGVATGLPDYDLPFSHVLSAIVPLLSALGLSDKDAQRILVDNPRDLLSLSIS
jgi:phosphotriesterase-related protein